MDWAALLPVGAGVAAGLIALAGVGLTLAVTGARERERQRLEREDAHRQELRAAVAQLIASAIFAKGVLLAALVNGRFDDGAPPAASDFGHQAVSIRLLTTDDAIVDRVDALNLTLHTLAALVDEGHGGNQVTQARMDGATHSFDQACFSLIETVRVRAAPTVRLKDPASQ